MPTADAKPGRRPFGRRFFGLFYGIGVLLCGSVGIGLGSALVRPTYVVLAIVGVAAVFGPRGQMT